MALTVVELVDLLQQHALLHPSHLPGLSAVAREASDARSLLLSLVERGWLTKHQANFIHQGKAEQLVLGTHVILEPLGQGGMGMVYKARHKNLDRLVALKTIHPDRVPDQETLLRFRREARAAAGLVHPNVVVVFDADHAGGTHFYAMEYVDGINLAQLVRERGPLPLPMACELIAQAAQGLQAAHEKGLVHRDVKPGNLIVAGWRPQASGPLPADATVKILDFGLARFTTETVIDGRLTDTGRIMGTPDFIAPEQASDSRTADIRADIFSLGCTLYFVLTGKTPFGGRTLLEKLAARNRQTPQVRLERPEVPAALDAFLKRMMAPRSEDRPQTPGEVVAALAPYRGRLDPLTGHPQGQPDPSATVGWQSSSFASPLRRPRMLAAAIAGALAALALILTLVYAFRVGQDEPFDVPTAKDVHGETKPPDIDRGEKKNPSPGKAKKAEVEPPEKPTPGDDPRLPRRERLAWQPQELVAVFGTQRARHWHKVEEVVFLPGNRLVTAETIPKSAFRKGGTSLTLWDADMLSPLAALPDIDNHGLGAIRLAVSPNGRLVACGSDRGIRLYEVGPDRLVEKGETAPLDTAAGLVFVDDETLLAAGSDWSVHRVDAVPFSAKPREVWRPEPPEMIKVARSRLSPCGRFQVLVDPRQPGKQFLRLREFAAGKPKDTTLDVLVQVGALTVARNALALAAALDNSIRLYRRGKDGYRSHDIELPQPRELAFDPDGKRLVVAHADGALTLIDLAGKTPLVRGPFRHSRADAARRLAFSPDGARLATLGNDDAVRLWQATQVLTPLHLESDDGHLGPVHALVFAPDGKSLYSGSGSRSGRSDTSVTGSLKQWNVDTGALLASLEDGRSRYGLVVSRDGKMMAAGSVDLKTPAQTAVIEMFRLTPSLAARHEPVPLGMPGAPLLAADRDLGVVLSVSGGFQPLGVPLLYLSAGNPKPLGIRKTFMPTALAVSPDGGLAVLPHISKGPRSGPPGKRRPELNLVPVAKLADVAPSEEKVPPGHLLAAEEMPLGRLLSAPEAVPFAALAFTPDGKNLVSGDMAGFIHMWDLAKEGPVASFPSWEKERPLRAARVMSLAFTDGGDFMAAALADGKVHLFDTLRGSLLLERSWTFPGSVHSVAFRPGPQMQLAVGGSNGAIYLLDWTRAKK